MIRVSTSNSNLGSKGEENRKGFKNQDDQFQTNFTVGEKLIRERGAGSKEW